MNVQDKALTAVTALADLVKALRVDGDTVAVDRYDYEQMLANQSDEYSEQLAHAMQQAFDSSPVAVSYDERQQMVLDYAGKPARVFTQWDCNDSSGWADRGTFQTAQIELRHSDYMRLSIPVGYSKVRALRELATLAIIVEQHFDDAREQAQQLAKRELPSAVGAGGLETPF